MPRIDPRNEFAREPREVARATRRNASRKMGTKQEKRRLLRGACMSHYAPRNATDMPLPCWQSKKLGTASTKTRHRLDRKPRHPAPRRPTSRRRPGCGWSPRCPPPGKEKQPGGLLPSPEAGSKEPGGKQSQITRRRQPKKTQKRANGALERQK